MATITKEHSIWAWITEKEKEYSDLRNRWDFDADLIDIDRPYVMRDLKGEKEARVFHVTIPNAALFYAKIWALIAGVSRLPTINSKILKDGEKADIINFIQDYDYEIDSLLNNKGEQSAFVTHAGFFCARGWSVEQHLSRPGKGGKWLADVRQIDPRWFTYSSGINGLERGCAETLRSKADIEEEFNISITGETAIIKDYWNRKKEKIFLSEMDTFSEGSVARGRQIDERDNPYGVVPFIVQAVPFGPGILRTRDYLKRRGESIFYPHRKMFDELNFMASILKTKAYDDLYPALQMVGDKLAKTPKKYAGTSKSTIALENALQLVPTRGMTTAMQQYMRTIEGIIQRSGLSDIDQGTLNFPLSAIALTTMMAVKESLTLPRLSAMAELYQARTRMIISQVQHFTDTIEIGPENTKRKYDTDKLSGPYTITWEYRSESLEEMAAKVAIGNSMKGMLADNDIRKDVWKRKNPKADEDALEVQEAKNQYPIIKLIERINSLIDADTEESQAEAWILHHQLTTELKQRVAQGVQPIEPIKPPTSQQQIKVFGGGGAAGGPQPVTKESQPRAEGEI